MPGRQAPSRRHLAAALAIAALVASGCGKGSSTPAPPPLADRSAALPANDLSTTDVQAGDLDGDGDLDLVWVSQPDALGNAGGVDVTRNLGRGVFAAADEAGFPDVGSWTFVRLADVDGDGDLDLVLSRPATTRVELLLLRNDGAAGFTQDDAALPAITGAVHGYVFGRVAAGDVDGDGDLDLLVPVLADTTFTQSMPNLLLLNAGDGTFAVDDTGRLPALPSPDDATLCVVLADLDGDGDLDLAVANDTPTGGQPAPSVVLRNDGAGHFTATDLPSTDTPHDARGLAVADLDRDGHLDLLLTNATEFFPHGGTALEVLLGHGDGTFTPAAGLPDYLVGAFGVAAGDLDGDGWPDVAIAVAEPAAGTTALANILLLTGP